MDQPPATETVDETLLAGAERIRTSRELLEAIDQRLARSAELLEGEPPVIDLRDDPTD